MFRAAAAVAFCALLGSPEHTAPTSRKYKKSCTLQQEDITILDARMLVQIKRYKTDPFREGVTISIEKTKASVCPVAVMQAYYSDCKPSGRGHLFPTSTIKFLTRGMMCKPVNEIPRFNNLSIHQSRFIRAAAAGIPDNKIKNSRSVLIFGLSNVCVDVTQCLAGHPKSYGSCQCHISDLGSLLKMFLNRWVTLPLFTVDLVCSLGHCLGA